MIFDDLPSAELAVIERVGRMCAFEPGQVLIEEGVTESTFFLILEGQVEVRKRVGANRYRRLAELGPGGLLGEICFLGVAPRTAGAVAIGRVRALEFTRATLDAELERRPEIGLKVYRGMARELGLRLASTDEALRDALAWAVSCHPQTPDGAVDVPPRAPLRIRRPS